MMRKWKFLLMTLYFSLILASCATTNPKLDDVYDQGMQAYQSGRYKEAVKHFKVFVQEKPNNPLNEVVLYYLAESYRNSGDSDRAMNVYMELINKHRSGFWVEQARKDLKHYAE
ncbi:MAG: tetratricopeptide repeat protein [Candidatus Omnitrophica bacterium]|nr:tetratricopeptide repeat protein [Candidatus Omnitrophota bacterium]